MSHRFFFPQDPMLLPSAWRAMATAESQLAQAATSSASRARGSHVSENDDRILLTVDVPGVKAKHLSVKIENGVLSISGSRTMKLHRHAPEGETSTKKYKFCKTFAIDSHTVDITQAKANLADGVLVFTAPKKAKPDCIIIHVTEDPNEDESESESEEQQQPELKRKAIKPEGEEEHVVTTSVKEEDNEATTAGTTGVEK